jgi:hypothetical protein
VDEEYLLDVMVKKNPGIRREIMQTSISLFQEAIAEEVCNGNSANIGLCRFVAQFTGVIRNNAWDKNKNSIVDSARQTLGTRDYRHHREDYARNRQCLHRSR